MAEKGMFCDNINIMLAAAGFTSKE